MKILTFILMLLFCSICNGQKRCDSGYSWMPTIGTSSLLIEADTCLPDYVCRRLWNEFHKSVCLETSSGVMEIGGNGSISFDEDHTWSDSLGCKVTYKYMVMRKNRWIAISKKQYNLILKKRK